MHPTEQSIGRPEDVRRWAENRRIANVLEVRDLMAHWGEPERAVQAHFELLNLWQALHGGPPPESPIDRRDNLLVWERFARLRRPFIR